MSELAKKARAAMKSKADRLGASRPLERVDAATWTPPELLNADVKTGLRPVSKRQFKKGGKVKGDPTVARADRKPRKSGGRAITADSLVNRNVKEANEQREGIKHIGGMKKGGRAKKANGGAERMPLPPKRPPQEVIDRLAKGQSARETNVEPSDLYTPEQVQRLERGYKKGGKAAAKCYGGKAKKAIGGPSVGAQAMMDKAKETAGVPSDIISSVPATSRLSKSAGLKKGGKAEAHSDEKMDRALIKKMVKPSARTGKSGGGDVPHMGARQLYAQTYAKNAKTAKMSNAATEKGYDAVSKKFGSDIASKLRAYHSSNERNGDSDDRQERKAGGRTKGKTNINIVIAAGKPQGQGMGAQPPADAPVPPAGLPVPVPPPQGAPQGMPMPMPMPPQGGAPAGAPPMPPMARKAGGRISKVAKSYKDMTAGAGSGEGRLQKADIAKRNAHKAGGKVYRSYKDMDAGAGSGLGRLEKTEIQSRKK